MIALGEQHTDEQANEQNAVRPSGQYTIGFSPLRCMKYIATSDAFVSAMPSP
jgi:hypothetical protein